MKAKKDEKLRGRRFAFTRLVAPLLMCVLASLMTLETDRTGAARIRTTQGEPAKKVMTTRPMPAAEASPLRHPASAIPGEESAAPLTGEAAIGELKQQGAYDSLLDEMTVRHPDVRFDRTPMQRKAVEQIGPASVLAAAWPQQAQLTASNAVDRDRFGLSVAVSGNTAIVGRVDGTDERGVFHPPEAYIFVRTGVDWTEQQILYPPSFDCARAFASWFSILECIACPPRNNGHGGRAPPNRRSTTWH